MVFGDFNDILKAEEHSLYDTNPTVLPGMHDFQEAVQHCSLSDLPSHGPLYTWCNKPDFGLICKKLDRILVNDSWLTTFRQSYGVFEAGGCSDHLRCRIKIGGEQPKLRRPFKFTNALVEDPDFLPMVKEFWEDTDQLYHSTSAMFRFSKKLKSLKPKIKQLSRERFGDLEKKAKEAFEHLCACQMETMQTPTDQAMRCESVAYNRWLFVLRLEENFLKQRSKLHWLKVGDGNNKVFHRAAKAWEIRNAVKEILCPGGIIADTQESIKIEAERFFREFLGHKIANYQPFNEAALSELLRYRCSAQDQDTLVMDVTETEIKDVLFSMPKDKSPGPDGYTVEFLIVTWSIVKKDFITSVQSFFQFGFIPKGVNTTILALIPKKKEVEEMKDYRPISCCNVTYKVISKILANRLKRLLPDFISPNQSAFVKDRLLMENVLLASEIVADCHSETISPRSAIKIDISKAFDSVQWPFLFSILRTLQFPLQFIRWIELCITTASFSVQVNGELSGLFQSARGLRQGCSLSPYLFVICMQVLSLMLDKAAQERHIGYHPRCKNVKLTHLRFADDLLVFTDGTKTSIEGILKVFTEFAESSGLNISLEKSTLYMAGVTLADRETILSSFPFASGTLPVHYLGLPLLTKRMTTSDYTPLIERIRDRFSSWTGRYLSFAGRLQLINSVIHSLTNFWMSAFRLPTACIKEIDGLCSAFLWSGPSLNTKKAKVSWHDVCKLKDEGGLGLRSLQEVNKVSCLKLIWRLLSSTSLWATWLRTYLFKKGSFWSVPVNTTSGSWMWRKLLKYRTVAADYIRYEVKNGERISFWHDNWSPLGCLLNLAGQRGTIDMGITIHATVAEALNHRPRRHRVDHLNQMEQALDNIRNRGRVEAEDVVLWKGKGDVFKQKFSTQETWERTRISGQRKSWTTGVWFKQATPKYSFMVWIAAQNRLTTGDRMLRWNAQIDASCSLCGAPQETRNHLFFTCSYSTDVWSGLTSQLLARLFSTDWETNLSLLRDTSLGTPTLFLLRYTFHASLQSFWQERNNRRHGEPPIISTLLVTRLDRQVRNRLLSLPTTGKFAGCMERWLASRLRR